MRRVTAREPGAHCSSCGAPILWAKYTTGARMPLDREPVPGGTLRVERGPSNWSMAGSDHYHLLCFWDRSETEPRYQSHFASCPQAQEHRKAAGLAS
jgi:hypothetical protein